MVLGVLASAIVSLAGCGDGTGWLGGRPASPGQSETPGASEPEPSQPIASKAVPSQVAPPSTTTSKAVTNELDTTVYFMGYLIKIERASYDPDERSIHVEARFTNTGTASSNVLVIADRNQANVESNDTFITMVFDGSRPTDIPGNATASNALESVSVVPDDFSLDDARLVFGTSEQRQAFVPLRQSGVGESDMPRDFAVTGTVTIDSVASVTFLRGQVVPATCFTGSQFDRIAFAPARKDEESILIWSDLQALHKTSDTAPSSYLTSADGTASAGNPGGSYLGVLQAIRNGILCYTVESPAAGNYLMNWSAARSDTTATFELTVP